LWLRETENKADEDVVIRKQASSRELREIELGKIGM